MLGDHCKYLHPPKKEVVKRTERHGMGRKTVLEQLLAAERRFHAEREHAPTEPCVPDGCEFMRGGAVTPTPEMPVGVPVTEQQVEFSLPGVLLASAAPFAPGLNAAPILTAAPAPAVPTPSAPAETEWLDEWIGMVGIRSDTTVSGLIKIFQDAEIDTPEQFALLFGEWIKKGKPRVRTNPVKELQECIRDVTGAKLKGGVVGKLLTAMRGDAQIQNLIVGYD